MISSQLLPIEVSSCNVLLVVLYHYSGSYLPSLILDNLNDSIEEMGV